MYTHQAIVLDSWVRVEEDCPLTCEVIGSDANFEFGTMSGGLHLTVTEDALVTLVAVATEALTRLQAIPPGNEVEFVVHAPQNVEAA
ncbi:MAG TPA: hypothetical protein VHX38_26330 [Pseudonocardiaceae bacterium]|jgi:hypothetical protein|nr:hypothetical protein [Pseudonocardiaceae bacterium]